MTFHKIQKIVVALIMLILVCSLIFFLNFKIIFRNKIPIGVQPRSELASIKKLKEESVEEIKFSSNSAIAVNNETIAITDKNLVFEVDILTGKITRSYEFNQPVNYLLDIQDGVVKYITLVNYSFWYAENNELKKEIQSYNFNTTWLDQENNTTKNFSFAILSTEYIKETGVIEFVTQRDTNIFNVNSLEEIFHLQHFEIISDDSKYRNRGRVVSKDGSKNISSTYLYNNTNGTSFKFLDQQDITPISSHFSENDENIVFVYTNKGLDKVDLETKKRQTILTDEEIRKLGIIGLYIANQNGDIADKIGYKEAASSLPISINGRKVIMGDILFSTPDKKYLVVFSKQNYYDLVSLEDGKYKKTVQIGF